MKEVEWASHIKWIFHMYLNCWRFGRDLLGAREAGNIIVYEPGVVHPAIAKALAGILSETWVHIFRPCYGSVVAVDKSDQRSLVDNYGSQRRAGLLLRARPGNLVRLRSVDASQPNFGNNKLYTLRLAFKTLRQQLAKFKNQRSNIALQVSWTTHLLQVLGVAAKHLTISSS